MPSLQDYCTSSPSSHIHQNPYSFHIHYLQDRLILQADLQSSDINLYCMAHITTCVLCVLCHASSLLEDKYVITSARGNTGKKNAHLRPISNMAEGRVRYWTQKRYIFPYSTRACVVTCSSDIHQSPLFSYSAESWFFPSSVIFPILQNSIYSTTDT